MKLEALDWRTAATRNSDGGGMINFTPEQDVRLLKAWKSMDQPDTIRLLAKRFQCSTSTIHKRLKIAKAKEENRGSV